MQSKNTVNIVFLLKMLHYSIIIVFINCHNFHHIIRLLESCFLKFGSRPLFMRTLSMYLT